MKIFHKPLYIYQTVCFSVIYERAAMMVFDICYSVGAVCVRLPPPYLKHRMINTLPAFQAPPCNSSLRM